jgi:hypothetical protein
MLDLTIIDIEDLIGKKWTRGAIGPDEYDCWGLVHECLKRRGFKSSIHVNYSNPNKLDIEFIKGRADSRWIDADSSDKNPVVLFYRGDSAQHIGIQIDGYIVHALGGETNQGSVQLTKLRALEKIYTKVEFLSWQD